MPDREKVISHFQDAIEASGSGKRWRFVRVDMIEDAIVLLREQEAVEPDGENCGECGYTLHRINYDGPDKDLRHEWFRFCPSCGKKAKWDA